MNRLGNATSPYLQQHRDNPVDWWEWSADALAEAKRLDRPILLSVGYAACHWCHVSFDPCASSGNTRKGLQLQCGAGHQVVFECAA